MAVLDAANVLVGDYVLHRRCGSLAASISSGWLLTGLMGLKGIYAPQADAPLTECQGITINYAGIAFEAWGIGDGEGCAGAQENGTGEDCCRPIHGSIPPD
jgi:hypothetical protein